MGTVQSPLYWLADSEMDLYILFLARWLAFTYQNILNALIVCVFALSCFLQRKKKTSIILFDVEWCSYKPSYWRIDEASTVLFHRFLWWVYWWHHSPKYQVNQRACLVSDHIDICDLSDFIQHARLLFPWFSRTELPDWLLFHSRHLHSTEG